MRIGEVAKEVQMPVDTIRFYERVGLLPKPGRTASNYRTYSNSHVDRLIFIRRCRGLDMSLDEIRLLLQLSGEPQRQCDTVNDILEEHIGQVESRIVELQSLEKQLKQLRTVCHGPGKARRCEVLKVLRAA